MAKQVAGGVRQESALLLFYVPVPGEEEARRMARALLDERLVACANLAPLRSLYRWEGEVRDEAETLLLLKTRRALGEACACRIRELHPYEVPCIAAFDMPVVNAEYAAWVEAETGGGAPGR